MNKQTRSIPLDIGSILTLTWDQFLNNSGLILLFSAIVTSPTILISIATSQIATNEGNELVLISLEEIEPLTIILFLSGFVLYMIAAVLLNVVTTVTFMESIKTSNSYSFGEAFSMGMKKFKPLFIINIVTGLIILGGLILFIIPGILFALWFMYTQYVTADKPETSVRDALRQSRSLFTARPSLPILWILLSIAFTIASSILLLPFSYVLGLASPVIADVVINLLSATVGYFSLLGIINVYFAAKEFARTKAGEVIN